MKKVQIFAIIMMMVSMVSCSFFNQDGLKLDPIDPPTPPVNPGKPYETITENNRTDGMDSLMYMSAIQAVANTIDSLFVENLKPADFVLSYGSVEEGVSSSKSQGKFFITDFSDLCRVSLSNGTDSIAKRDTLKSSEVMLTLKDTSYTFTKGKWSVQRGDKEIGTETHPTINGKSYIAIPVVVTMYYKYTATSEYIQGANSQVLSLTHTLVLLTLDSIQGRHDTIENESYQFAANVANAGMTSSLNSTVNVNSYDNVVKVYEQEQSRTSVTEPMNLTVTARLSKTASKVRNIGQPVEVATHTTGMKSTSDVVTPNGFLRRTTTFSEHYTFDDGQTADFDCSHDNLMKENQPFMGYTEITSVNLRNADITVDDNRVVMNPKVMLKKHEIDGSTSMEEKVMELAYMQEEEDYILYTFVESSVTPNGNSFTATADFYAQWNLQGRQLITSKTATLNASLNAQDGADVDVKNVNFTTTGNGATGTGRGTYTDNATNGTVNFSNTYAWSADGDVTLSYDTLSVTFKASFALSEGGQNIGQGTPSSDGKYTVYPYANTVNAVYTVNGQSLNLSATAHRNLRIKKEAEDVVDGTILGVQLTYVPVLPGTLVGGSGQKVIAKCFAIDRELNGQMQKVLVVTPTSTVFPTATEIANGTVRDGDFRNYNSAEYRPYGWVPATAQNRSGSDDWTWTAWTGDATVIAASTVAKWNWGISTPIISEFQAIDNGDGTFTLKMNNAVVLWK
jgi:hypothetical protein